MKNPFKRRTGRVIPGDIAKVQASFNKKRELPAVIVAEQAGKVAKVLETVVELQSDAEFNQRIKRMQRHIQRVQEKNRANLERELEQFRQSYLRMKSMPSILID